MGNNSSTLEPKGYTDERLQLHVHFVQQTKESQTWGNVRENTECLFRKTLTLIWWSTEAKKKKLSDMTHESTLFISQRPFRFWPLKNWDLQTKRSSSFSAVDLFSLRCLEFLLLPAPIIYRVIPEWSAHVDFSFFRPKALHGKTTGKAFNSSSVFFL